MVLLDRDSLLCVEELQSIDDESNCNQPEKATEQRSSVNVIHSGSSLSPQSDICVHHNREEEPTKGIASPDNNEPSEIENMDLGLPTSSDQTKEGI